MKNDFPILDSEDPELELLEVEVAEVPEDADADDDAEAAEQAEDAEQVVER